MVGSSRSVGRSARSTTMTHSISPHRSSVIPVRHSSPSVCIEHTPPVHRLTPPLYGNNLINFVSRVRALLTCLCLLCTAVRLSMIHHHLHHHTYLPLNVIAQSCRGVPERECTASAPLQSQYRPPLTPLLTTILNVLLCLPIVGIHPLPSSSP